MLRDESAVSQEFVGLSINQSSGLDHSESPPPPPVSSEGIVALDITKKFINAARTLEPGQLVKDGYFTLFESVGALEIMDPKMDSGCLAPGESLDEDYDVTRPLAAEQVLGIIDQLLCHEMAWHLGYPLSQTLFTNVYIEAILMPPPMSVEDADFVRNRSEQSERDPLLAVLRAYCLGLLKACWYVNERIKFEHYYEEEDFVTNTYHRTLLDHIDRAAIVDVIQEARALLHDARHTVKEETAQALDFRLELRLAFLRAIELTELRSNPRSLTTPWIQMDAILEPINKSHPLGIPVPEAFSAKIQRRLASTMPPRPIVQLSFDDTYSNFKRLVADGLEVTDVLDFTDSQSLLNFVLSFQAKKPQPLVYIRTLLQNYLFKDMVILGSLSIRQIVDNDLSTVVLPCSRLLDPSNDGIEAPHDPRFAMAHQMEMFRQRAAQSYLDIFRAFCQNRSRVRRTLCHSIQDWETVQADAEDIDQLLQVQLDEKPMMYQSLGTGSDPAYSLPLSSWAYLYKLRLMEWIVQLGFELDVYYVDELAGMYWYLSYLAKTRAQHVERIKAFTVRSMEEHKARPQGLGATKEAQFARSLAYLRVTMLDAAVVWELADGLSCLYSALERLGLVVPPPRPYSTDALRYDIRMKPFATTGLPELPSFEAFTRATAQPDISTSSLLEYAERAVGGAKKGYEVLKKLDEKESFTVKSHARWVTGTVNCLRSAIATGLAISVVKKALAETPDGSPLKLKVGVKPPQERYHDWWTVPNVSRIS